MKNEEVSIQNLFENLLFWDKSKDPICRRLKLKFDYIFYVNKRTGKLKISKSFKKKLFTWFAKKPNLVQEVDEQSITFILNQLTNEQTIFNPLRDKRPVKKPAESQRAYVENLQEDSLDTCDFCKDKFEENTANDYLGRLANDYAYTTSNAFKYDAWHSLIILK